MKTRTALILGATGGIGGEVASRLLAAGWWVRALHRDPSRAKGDPRIAWIKGDALCASDVADAADGASLIVHAVNPPGYRNWSTQVLPMLNNTIAAAELAGARILLPGTVYNYGRDVFPDIAEDAPQNARTRKGRIRVEMERRLKAAADRGWASVLIVRAGDFFGPQAANNWFSQGLVKPGARPRLITYPGKPGIGHQWAYLPDVAEVMTRLVERDDLADFATFHMEGHWDADGTRMTGAIREALAAPDLPIRRLPWSMMQLAAPFVPLMRELVEMKYLWNRPIRLRNDRLVSLIGPEPHTPLDQAVHKTLQAIGALQEAQPTPASRPGSRRYGPRETAAIPAA